MRSANGEKLSMFLLALLLLGLLVLNGGEFKNSKDSNPSSLNSTETSTKPVREQRLPKAYKRHDKDA